MITFVCRLRAAPGQGAAVEALLAHVRDQSLAHEPGVAHYGFGEAVEAPGHYVVVEVYRDAAAHAAHMATEWVRQSIPRMQGLVEGPIAVEQYVAPGTIPAVRQYKEG